VVAATIATGSAPMPTRDDVIAALRPGSPSAEATAAAAELSPAHARDRAWFGIEQMHHTGQDLHATAAAYLDIARHSEQDHRATGAWFLYAWTNWQLGDSVRTGAALDHIYAIDPPTPRPTCSRLRCRTDSIPPRCPRCTAPRTHPGTAWPATR
jgi:hypothetical protein